jgi:hypothetical protein
VAAGVAATQDACPADDKWLEEGRRPKPCHRKFNSTSIEAVITSITSKLRDPNISRLFENGLPNTLDTTTEYHKDSNDTFVM